MIHGFASLFKYGPQQIICYNADMKKVIKSAIEKFAPVGAQAKIWRAYNRLAYGGERYHCPLCGAHLKTLWPRGLTHPVLTRYDIIGGGYRQQASCPICGSTERERLVFLYIMHRTDLLQRPARLLHVAPEPQLSAVLQQSPHLDYLSADLYEKNVMVEMDITDIAYPDASFDVIICNHVLEHILEDARAMRELFRVLAPGGWAILQVPISEKLSITLENPSIVTPEARARAFGQEDHVRIYARRDYIKRLRAAGFQVTPFAWWDAGEDFGNPHNHYALMPRETLFVAQK